MLVANITKWITLIAIIALVIFVIKTGMKIANILIMVFMLAFVWYSFFTEEGCARLSVALSGHPLIAYTTGMERQDDISTNDTTYYKTTKDVVINGKKQEYVKCYTKWIIRIPNVGDMTH